MLSHWKTLNISSKASPASQMGIFHICTGPRCSAPIKPACAVKGLKSLRYQTPTAVYLRAALANKHIPAAENQPWNLAVWKTSLSLTPHPKSTFIVLVKPQTSTTQPLFNWNLSLWQHEAQNMLSSVRLDVSHPFKGWILSLTHDPNHLTLR